MRITIGLVLTFGSVQDFKCGDEYYQRCIF